MRLRPALDDGWRALLCALVAVVAGLLAMVATQDGSLHPGKLTGIADNDLIAPYVAQQDPGFRFVTPSEHYDGTYYWTVGVDPVLHGTAHTLIDQTAYRYGHPLHGWLAFGLSLGKPAGVSMALLLLGLGGLGASGWAVSLLSVALGRTAWAGVLVALSPGLLFAASADTTETVGVALIALALLAWVRERYGLAAVLLVLVCLDKEQYVTVPLGLVLWELAESVRGRRLPPRLLRKVVAVLAGPVALSLWYLYVHARLDAWPWTYENGNLGPPLVGWKETFHRARTFAEAGFDQSQIGTTTAPTLVAVAALLVLGFLAALRLRTVLDAVLLGMVVIVSMQGWRTLLYPHELIRTPAVAILFAIAVLLTRREVLAGPDRPDGPGRAARPSPPPESCS